MLASLFPLIDGTDLSIIFALLSVIGGTLWKIVLWSQTKGEQLVGFVKPKIEQFASSHNHLMDTLAATQVENTAHIGLIKTTLVEVNATMLGQREMLVGHREILQGNREMLSGNKQVLERIEKQCQTISHPASPV